jgi:hypothetical protein
VDEEPRHFAANFMLPPQASANPCRPFSKAVSIDANVSAEAMIVASGISSLTLKAFDVPVLLKRSFCGVHDSCRNLAPSGK